MFAVGHIDLGYLTGKAASKLLETRINIRCFSLSPFSQTTDFLLGPEHREPTHSIIAQTIVFIPVFALSRKSAVPVFAALVQHSLIGDLLPGAGGIQILWPVTSRWFGTQIFVTNTLSITVEWIAFTVFMALLCITRDSKSLFQHHQSNLLLTVLVLAVILPSFLQFPLAVPTALIIHSAKHDQSATCDAQCRP